MASTVPAATPPMTNPVAEIFSQGDEVVNGEIADTNAAWLSSELIGLGFTVSRHTAVGDRLEALTGLLREIAGRADLCLCSGGLGPTTDDLTAQAVSLAFGRPLRLDAEALAQIEDWFHRMGRPMAAVNRKQAWLPEGADRLDNDWGTAPGFALQAGRCRFFFMPGVPKEMQAMFRQAIRPALPGYFALTPLQWVILRTIGLGESTLQERLDPIVLPAGVHLGVRTGGAENQVKLTFPPQCPSATVNATVEAVAAAIGVAVYATVRNGEGPVSLAEVAGQRLAARGARLYLVETLSGGALAAQCNGADWLAGARVATAPERLLSAFAITPGATPDVTVKCLARTVREREGVDYALVQYGEGPAADRQDGLARTEVWYALAGPKQVHAESRVLTGTLPRQRAAAAAHGLDVLRRQLPEA